MDEPKPAEPAAAAADAPKPANNGAVMDVVAPPPVEKIEDAVTNSDKPADAPATPPDEQPATDVAQKTDAKVDVEPAKPAKPKTPRGPNVKLAIIATVIIVVGLAALATYAFLQSNK